MYVDVRVFVCTFITIVSGNSGCMQGCFAITHIVCFGGSGAVCKQPWRVYYVALLKLVM